MPRFIQYNGHYLPDISPSTIKNLAFGRFCVRLKRRVVGRRCFLVRKSATLDAPAPGSQHWLLLTKSGLHEGGAVYPTSIKSYLTSRPDVTCEFVSDILGAVTRLTKLPVIDVMLLDPDNLTPLVLDTLALIRKHRALPIWVLDSGSETPAIFRALALGACRASAELANQQFRAAVSEEAPQAPDSLSSAPEKLQPMSIPSAEPRKTRTFESGLSQEPVKNPSAPEIPISKTPRPQYYDEADALEPLLTEAEIRALLGS